MSDDDIYLAYNPLAENNTLVFNKTKINKTIKIIQSIRNNECNKFFNYDKVTFNNKCNLTLKILNWYIIPIIKNYKLCIICTRDINTKKKYYFSFEFLQHFFLLEEEKSEIENFLKLGHYLEFNIQKINKNQFKIKELYNYCKILDIKNILNEIKTPENIIKKIYLIKSNIKILDSCSVLFNGSLGSHQLKPFLILNNIIVDGVYNINNIILKRNNINNVYFIEDELIQSFFKDPYNQIFKSIDNIVSFDIENIISKKNGVIFSEYNIIPMIAYTINYLSQIFSFVFINIDYIISDIIKNNHKDLFNTENIENIYDNVLLKKKSNSYFEYYNLNHKIYDNKFINNSLNLSSYCWFEDLEDFIKYLISNNIKYIYASEYDLIIFIKQLLENDLFDIICHYNGNGYDYNMIEIRRKYILKKLKLEYKKFTLKKFYNFKAPIKVNQSKKKNLRIIFDLPIKNFDLLTLARILLENKLDNISLNDVSRFYFSNKGIIKNTDKYYIYNIILENIIDPKKREILNNLYSMVNYVEIEGVPFKLISFIQNNNTNMLVIETINLKKSTLLNLNLDKTLKISIIKDDINILDNNVYNLNSIIQTSKYCMTDSALPCFLLDIMNYFQLTSVESNICKIVQCQTLQYHNSTKLYGPFLKSCLDNKIFLTKNQMIIKSSDKKGGYVFTPKEHLNTNTICILDFKSLYPFIMKSYNLSPDTFINSYNLKDKFEFKLVKSYIKNNPKKYDDFNIIELEDTNTFNLFSKKENGILGIILNELLDERDKARKNESESVDEFQKLYYSVLSNYLKILANSIYGLTGVTFESIYLSTEVAESICALGRCFINNTHNMTNNLKILNNEIVLIDKNMINIYKNEKMILCESTILKKYKLDNPNYDIECIYGDTDSIMVKIKSNVKNIKDEIIVANAIVEQINYLANKKLEIKLETMMLSSYLKKKKNYAFYSLDYIDLDKIINMNNKQLMEKKELVIKGIQSTKRSVCLIHRNLSKKFIRNMLDLLLDIKFDVKDFNRRSLDELYNLCLNTYNKWINDENNNNVNIKDFLIYSSYKKSKSGNNDTDILVNKYNNTEGISEFIFEGNKYPYYYYIEDEDVQKVKDDYQKYINTLPKNKSKKIYDSKLKGDNFKINYPLYLYKIVKSLLGFFIEKDLDKETLKISNNIYLSKEN